jgi:hypothetical protein
MWRVEDNRLALFSEEDGQKTHGRISFIEPPVPLGARLHKSLTGFERDVVTIFEFNR